MVRVSLIAGFSYFFHHSQPDIFVIVRNLAAGVLVKRHIHIFDSDEFFGQKQITELICTSAGVHSVCFHHLVSHSFSGLHYRAGRLARGSRVALAENRQSSLRRRLSHVG
jgi:hypothetical protein